MKKLLLLLSFIFGLTVLFFIVYTQFLVDYSLENLQFALSATTKKDPGEVSPLVNSLYGTLVQDQAIEAISKGQVNLNALALMTMAARSFEEGSYRNGYERAKLYLKQLTQAKISERNPFLQFVDSAHRQFSGFFKRLFRYLRTRFSAGPAASFDQYSNDLILNEAQEFEKKGELKSAADLYRKYLALSPKNSNRGFVAVALADVMIRQNKLQEAETLLRKVMGDFSGLEEGDLAGRFLKKINFLKQGNDLIPQLKTFLKEAKTEQIREALQLKLALAHVSLYRLEPAEEILKGLLTSRNTKMSTQAKFYLGWVYKLRNQYGEGEKILLDLLDDPGLARDLELGLHAELADIYYQQNDSENAIKQYQVLRKKSKKDLEDVKKKTEAVTHAATEEAWSALSELETSNIYYFNLNDAEQANQHLDAAGKVLRIKSSDLAGMQKDFQQAPTATNLRFRAFRALEMRQVSLAYDLFKKNIIRHPADAWTFGGLSTIYVLLGDMDLAIENAERSYDLGRNDAYTAAALGYVYGLAGRYTEAAEVYRRAVEIDSNYFAAKFNLSFNYLKLEEFEKALEVLNRLDLDLGNARTPTHAKIRNNMGFALWKIGKREEAVKYFREALEMNPDFLVAKKNLNFSMGSTPEAAP